MRLVGFLVLLPLCAAWRIDIRREHLKSDEEATGFIERQGRRSLKHLICSLAPAGCILHDSGHFKAAISDVLDGAALRDYPLWEYRWQAGIGARALVEMIRENYTVDLHEKLKNTVSNAADVQREYDYAEDKLWEPNGIMDGPVRIRSGPAVVAQGMVAYSSWLADRGMRDIALNKVQQVLTNELQYTLQYWNTTGHDIWGTVNGASYFGASVQWRALVDAQTVGDALGVREEGYGALARYIYRYMQTFWHAGEDSQDNYMTGSSEYPQRKDGPDWGIDGSTILACVLNFDPLMLCDSDTFQPCSERALANHKAVTDASRRFPVSGGRLAWKGQGVFIGKIPGLTEYTLHPSVGLTIAAAEQLYDALYIWDKLGFIHVTEMSLGFFKQLEEDGKERIQTGTYSRGTAWYDELMANVGTYADGFIAMATVPLHKYGRLPGDVHRVNGDPLGHYNCPFAHAMFVTAARRRRGIPPPSWMPPSENRTIFDPPVPVPASMRSREGNYSTVKNVSYPKPMPSTGTAPTPTKPPWLSLLPTPVKPSEACPSVSEVSVVFALKHKYVMGRKMKVFGNLDALGGWEFDKAITLDPRDIAEEGRSKGVVKIRQGAEIFFMYVGISPNGTLQFETGGMRNYTIPKKCITKLELTDTWEGPPGEE